MPDEFRMLRLKFRLKHQYHTAADFRSLFDCAETYSRRIVAEEMVSLVSALQVDYGRNISLFSAAYKDVLKAPTPMAIESVERGSWLIETSLSASLLIWSLRPYLIPFLQEAIGAPMQDAWSDSRYRQNIVEFMQDKAFGGAAQSVGKAAAQRKRFGQLEVTNVQQETQEPETIFIDLERRTALMEIDTEDDIRELLEGWSHITGE